MEDARDMALSDAIEVAIEAHHEIIKCRKIIAVSIVLNIVMAIAIALLLFL